MATATITSKGQITIPKDIRSLYDLQSGDKISFISTDVGEVRFIPVKQNMNTIKGIVSQPSMPVSIKDMKNTIKAKGSVS